MLQTGHGGPHGSSPLRLGAIAARRAAQNPEDVTVLWYASGEVNDDAFDRHAAADAMFLLR